MQIEDIYGNLPTLETERLLLRKMTLDDAPDMFEYASDREVTRYTSWHAHMSLNDTLDFIKATLQKYESGKVSSWGIIYKENNKFIGACGFLSWVPQIYRAEIGYVLSNKYWNMGIMTEAMKAVISFGFEKMELNRIEAVCKPENAASERLLQKLGMSFEGIPREYVLLKGSYHDIKMYSLLKKEFSAR